MSVGEDLRDLALGDVEGRRDGVIGGDEIDAALVAGAREDAAAVVDGDGGEVGIGERVELFEAAVALDAIDRALALAGAARRGAKSLTWCPIL